MRFPGRLLAIGLLLAMAVPAAAVSRPLELVDVEMSSELELILVEAVRDHNQARDGVKGLAAEVISRLEEAESDIAQDHPVLLVYLGSAYTLMGRDSESVSNAIRFTNRGIRIMNEAVEIAPKNFAVLAVRAFNNINLPAMFGRRESAISDMKELIALYEKKPLSSRQLDVKSALEILIKVSETNGESEDMKLWKAKLNGLSLD